MQQCSTVASSFSDDVGVSPQDLILNGTRVDAHNEVFSKAEFPQDGHGILSTKSQDEDWTASISVPHNQSDSGTPALCPPGATSNLSRTEQTSPRRIKNRTNQYTDTQAELRKKRGELAAAEAVVSTLRNEVKALEASTKAFEEIRLENTPHTNKHKWSDDDTTHRAKRSKDNATVRHGEIGYSNAKRLSISTESWSPTTMGDANQMMNYMSPSSTIDGDTDTEHSFQKFFDSTSPSSALYGASSNTFKFESLQTNLLNEESKRQAVLVGS